MKSVDRWVLWVEPWLKWVAMPATFTPSPTWAGLVPPVSVGAEPLLSTWERVSWKTVWLDLKPTVLTLAMLLPTVSSLVWWALRPEMAENIERSMGNSSSRGDGGGAGRRRQLVAVGRETCDTRPSSTSTPPMTALDSPLPPAIFTAVTRPALVDPSVSV